MSYEGVEQFICLNGHKWEVDSTTFSHSTGDQQHEMMTCEICKARAEYACEVDKTNGYDENDPRTFDGPTEIVGFDDIWSVDHYGNKYAIKVDKHRPVGFSRWVLITS